MLSVAAMVGGCATPASFEDADPTSRLSALSQAVEQGDRSAIPDIISLLDSDDAAVRLFAILALQDMTGQTLGYDHAAPEPQRREAADRWQAWYLRSAEGPSADAPAEQGPAGNGDGTAEGRDGEAGGTDPEPRGGQGGQSARP